MEKDLVVQPVEKSRKKGDFHKWKLRSRNGKMPQLVMLLKQVHFQRLQEVTQASYKEGTAP